MFMLDSTNCPEIMDSHCEESTGVVRRHGRRSVEGIHILSALN